MNESCPSTQDLPHEILFMEDVGYVFILPAICVSGIVLNLLAAISFWKIPSVVFRYHLLFRSLMDMLTLLLVAPVGILRCSTCSDRSDDWTSFSEIYRHHIFLPLSNFTSTCSLWSTMLVSILRCCMLMGVRIPTPSHRVCLGALAALSAILNSPYLFINHGHEDNILDFLGLLDEHQFQAFSWVRVSLAHFLPTVLVAVTNCILVHNIVKLRHNSTFPSEDSARRQRHERTLTLMLICISVALLLAHVPAAFSCPGVFRSLFGECSVYDPAYRYFRL
ncbi:hypothetical protein CAPTEDRAFT_184919, partial [Capitella teleta]|uniref:G-protein coupled receptors family 1 profile domain-containing protein n=1 Tax=Capitella teleta TaxID=283909 RepID=X1ZH87_CAPTE